MTAPNVPTPFPIPLAQIAGRTLLIVDDEPVIRMIARVTLSAAGFIITEAGDGAAACDAIHKSLQPFDMILLDLTLGGTSGAELIPIFRLQSPVTKILVISGHGSEDAEGLGADGFLAKPFTKTSLLVAVWQTLSGELKASPGNP